MTTLHPVPCLIQHSYSCSMHVFMLYATYPNTKYTSAHVNLSFAYLCVQKASLEPHGSVRCRTSTTTNHAQCSLPDLNHDQPRPVFAARPQPRPSTPSVRCRTSTTTSHAQCSLPDLNHDHPRPVFAARPQPRPATPSVRCRTSTTTINAQCSLPDLNSYAKSYAR